MSLLLGFDFGTSYIKVGLFDPAGAVRGLGRVAVAVQATPAGRRELQTAVFWRLAREALDDALHQARVKPTDIAGVSYSSQANTFLLLDEAGAELTPLILWNDRRADVLPDDAAFSSTDAFQRAVGFRGIAAESAVTKCRWWQRERTAEWQRVGRVLTLSDYFTWTITGEVAGDASTAALLGLYHLGERRWWAAALEHFGLLALQLHQPSTPGTACGTTGALAGARLGLPAGIPFAVGALDHHAAGIGAGVGVFADASLSTGTVLAALRVVSDVAPIRGCFHGPHFDGVNYYRLAFDPRGAGEIEAFQLRHAPTRTLDDLVHQALSGVATDVTPGESAAGYERLAVREILERIAGAQGELLRVISPAQSHLGVVAATGGAARNVAWLAYTARRLGVRIVVPASAERACLGAAIFAAAAGGVHPTLAVAAHAMVSRPQVFAGTEAFDVRTR